MKCMKNNILIIFLVLIMGCNNEEKQVSINSGNGKSLSKLKGKTFKGDLNSYRELKVAYMDYSNEGFLFWAMLMANKYHHPQAYMDVFYVLVQNYSGEVENFNEMDTATQELALRYLEIAVEKKVEGASAINEIIKSKNNK